MRGHNPLAQAILIRVGVRVRVRAPNPNPDSNPNPNQRARLRRAQRLAILAQAAPHGLDEPLLLLVRVEWRDLFRRRLVRVRIRVRVKVRARVGVRI